MLQGISKGKCYVEMSTIDEETMQDVAEVSSGLSRRQNIYIQDVAEVSSGLSRRQNIYMCKHVVQNM